MGLLKYVDVNCIVKIYIIFFFVIVFGRYFGWFFGSYNWIFYGKVKDIILEIILFGDVKLGFNYFLF